MTAMMIAKRRFTFTDMDGSHGTVEAGERVVGDHALVRDFPDEFRDFTLDDELKIRSDWVETMRREEAERHTTSEPVSRAGRAEREELRFWDQVDQQLNRDERPAAERAEQAVFDDGLRQLERLDEARLREETDGLREMWAGRLPAER